MDHLNPPSSALSDLAQLDVWHMRQALALAADGLGYVEPNPLVGCLVTRGAEIIGHGWHRRFGGPHAEVEALAMAGERAKGATLIVTLEPCCHQGKTPPCITAILAAGIGRVVLAMEDPFSQVSGRGAALMRAAGLRVDMGICEAEARQLNSPYLKRVLQGQPWVIAKWAMSLDGKIATITGESRWISGEASRQRVHALRGRMDAIVIGRGTAAADDPLLTARPAGARRATRVVLDRLGSLPSDSQLVRTARDVPVLVAVSPTAPAANRQRLTAAGCEVLECAGETHVERWRWLLANLAARGMTNVLVEGGAEVLGTLLAAREVDEVQVFVAPLLIGGQGAPSPIAGAGCGALAEALRLENVTCEAVDKDWHLIGRTAS